MDCIAVGSYKETFANKLEIVHGSNYENEFNMENSLSPGTDNSFNYNNKTTLMHTMKMKRWRLVMKGFVSKSL